jgi:hypothetical protein
MNVRKRFGLLDPGQRTARPVQLHGGLVQGKPGIGPHLTQFRGRPTTRQHRSRPAAAGAMNGVVARTKLITSRSRR